MRFLKLLLFCIAYILVVLTIYSHFFTNDYKCLILMGRKGSGKTTISSRFALQFASKRNWHVFSDTPLYKSNKLDINWLGRYDFPENSLIIVDEGLISFDNRKFAMFSDELRYFFVHQRHKKIYVIILCQDFNLVDKKIRSLTDSIYVCVNYFNVLSVAKKVHKGTALTSDSEGSGSIAESYTWEFPTSWMFCWIPRYVCFFDSWQSVPLPKVKIERWRFTNEEYKESMLSWKNYKIDEMKRIWKWICNKCDMWSVPDGTDVCKKHFYLVKMGLKT